MTQKLTPTSGAASTVTTVPTATAQIPCLPDEMWLQIFTNLTAPETLAARLVCRNWHQLMEDDSLWRFFFGRDFQLSEVDHPKELYQRNYRTNPNLTHGIYSTTTFPITKGIVCNHACIKDEKFIVPNYDGDIEIWDLKNGTLLHAFKNQYDGAVTSLIVTEEGKVIAGYAKRGRILLWDLHTGQCERSLFYPSQMAGGRYIYEVARHFISENEKTLISVDDHCKVTIWDLETGKSAQTFSLMQSWGVTICSLIMTKEGNLITGEFNGRIRIWNREGECIRTIDSNSRGWVSALVLTKKGKLISRYESDARSKIWNLENGECERDMEEDLTHSCSLFLSRPETLLISGSEKTVKFWDLATGSCLLRMKGSEDRGSRVLFTEDEQLVLCSPDTGTVKVLNFRASNNEVFKELAMLFEADAEGRELAMQRFLKMPERERGQIYIELYKILKSREEGFSGSAAHAFHDLKGLSSTPAEKAQAIRNYLNR